MYTCACARRYQHYSPDSFCTCHGSEAHFSFKFPFGMEFQDSQKKVVRIRIKQSIWDYRAGIDSGLARKKIYFFFVGVLWVRLSAENESASFYRSGTNLEGAHTKASHIDSSLCSLLSMRSGWQEQGNQQVHRQLPWLQRGRAPREPASPALLCRHLHRKQGAPHAPPKPFTSKAWLIGKVSLLYSYIP